MEKKSKDTKWQEFKGSTRDDLLLKGVANAIDIAFVKKSYTNLLEVKSLIKEVERKEKYNDDVIKALHERIKEVEKSITGGESKDIGALVRTIRLARGLSLATLSELSGVSASYIHRLERGERRAPTTAILEKLSNALGEDILIFIKSSQISIGGEVECQLLASLLMSNSVKITSASTPISVEKKTVLAEIVKRLEEFKWDNENKLAETIELAELVDQWKKI